MILPIDDDWRIKSDANQWTVQRRGWDGKKECETWTGQYFYGTLEQALKGTIEARVRLIDTEGWADSMAAVDALVERMTAVLPTKITVSVG